MIFLLAVVSDDERVIVETFLLLKSGGAVAFHEMSEALLTWAKNGLQVHK